MRFIKLTKGMLKNEVNELIGKWLLLNDDVYMGNSYKHNWICKECGKIFQRTWNPIRAHNSIICEKCRHKEMEQRYKYEVEKDGEYEYIRAYFKGDVLPNGKIVKQPYLQVKHKYCGSIYMISTCNFINTRQECGQCCQKYENSFAHFIEVELNEPLEKYWDFKNNTVNPYYIWKSGTEKVWIKCTETNYHGNYEISCNSFSRGALNNNTGCSYCGNHKVHPKDSFAQYHIDNTDPNFLEKYWDFEKNTVSPWEISPSSKTKVWIKCQNEDINELNGLMKKDYHGSYEVGCDSFTNRNSRCGYCHPIGKHLKLHPYDSFGYHNFNKVQSWHIDNDISPFRVSRGSGKKYKFICYECGHVWEVIIASVYRGHWCPDCSASKGETRVKTWLIENDINYITQKTYNNLFGLSGGNLSYDFYLPNYNLLIEYQGEQHERYIKGFHDSYKKFEKQIEHDKRKREYVEENGIELLEIWYWDYDNVENILNEKLHSEHVEDKSMHILSK